MRRERPVSWWTRAALVGGLATTLFVVTTGEAAAPAPTSDAVSGSATVSPGTIDVVAGHRLEGPATAWPLVATGGMSVTPAGDVYVSDTLRSRVLRVSGASGELSVVAGIGDPGYFGDGHPATQAGIARPTTTAVSAAGVWYFVASVDLDRVVRKVDATGHISTVANSMNHAIIAADEAGDLFMSNGSEIVKVTPDGQQVAVLMTDGTTTISDVKLLAAGEAGYLYVLSNTDQNKIFRIALGGGPMFVRTIVPAILGVGQMDAMTVDRYGDAFVASTGLGRVWKLGSAATEMVPFAGSGAFADGGDGGPAVQAGLTYPNALGVDGLGRVYIGGYFRNPARRRRWGHLDDRGQRTARVVTRWHAGDGGVPQPSQRADRGSQR